ncbi:tetratricopeptide repeat protein [Botrimarina sp.]|uniref:tetratricopeptide repeat protein n=1 Tax=Botrimarina sp. TaxID=2795802 RepID=UPI0032EDD96A
MPLLLGTLVALVAVGGAIYYLRGWRQERLAEDFAARAEQLLGEEDFSRAAFYQQQYLQLRPDDFAARLELIDIFEASLETSPGNRQQLLRLLYETIGLASSDQQAEANRLRTQLAELLLDFDEFSGALEQTAEVRADEVEGEDLPARIARVEALAHHYRIQNDLSLNEAGRRDAYAGDLETEAVVPSLASLDPEQEESDQPARSFAELLQNALALNEADPELVGVAAELYRQYPDIFGDDDSEATRLADEMMQRLVDASPGDAEALLTRYAYRSKHNLDGADEDLRKILEADPDNVDALWLSMESALRQADAAGQAEAERLLNRLVEVAPDFEPAHVVLGRLLRRQGKLEEALGAAERAVDQLPEHSVEAHALLVDLHLRAKNAPAARDAIDDLREAIAADVRLRDMSQSQGVSLAEQQQRDRLVQLQEGRLAALEGQPGRAAELLKSYLNGAPADSALNGQSVEARQSLVAALESLGHWDQAASQLEDLVQALQGATNSDSAAAEVWGVSAQRAIAQLRLQAANDWLRADRDERASLQLRQVSGVAPMAAKTLGLLVEAKRQTSAPQEERDWSEFDKQLAEVKQQTGPSMLLFRAEAARRLTASAGAGTEGAALSELVDEYAKGLGDNAGFWRAAAEAFAAAEEPEQMLEAIDAYERLSSSEDATRLLRVELLSRVGKTDEAQQVLDEANKAAGGKDSAYLAQARVRLSAASGDAERALRHAREALKSHPDDRWLLQAAMVLALQNGELSVAEDLGDRIRRSGIFSEAEVAYSQANLLLLRLVGLEPRQKADRKALVDQLESLVSQMVEARPEWAAAHELAGKFALATGDAGAALESLQRAASLGPIQPKSQLALARLLSTTPDGMRQARGLLQQLSKGAPAGQSFNVEASLAMADLRLGDADKAEQRARELVEERPDDREARALLAEVLFGSGQLDEAERVVAEGREANPDDALLWGQSFMLATVRKDRSAIDRLLEEAPKAIKSNKAVRLSWAGRAYQSLGDIAAARDAFERAQASDPDNVQLRLQLADLLLSVDPRAAQPVLEEALDKAPDNEAVRRTLATVLAMAGPAADWDRIELLVGALEGGDEDASTGARRLKAVLLMERGRSVEERLSDTRRSQRLLQEVVDSPEGGLVDQVLLAAAYEREAKLDNDNPLSYENAANRLRFVVQKGEEGRPYRPAYAGLLIRSVEALSDQPETAELRERMVAQGRAVLSELLGEVPVDSEATNLKARLAIVSEDARLLAANGDAEAAAERLDRFAEEAIDSVDLAAADRLELAIQLGGSYSKVDAHKRAERWFRTAARESPTTRNLVLQSLVNQDRIDDAVNLLLESSGTERPSVNEAVLLSVVLSSGPSSESTYQRGWERIAAVLEEQPSSVPLLMSVAVLHTTRDEQTEAIEAFRSVLEVDPENVNALNNLATLLGEIPDRREEALALAEQGLQLTAGIHSQQSMLLDTKGSIYLSMGLEQEAINALESAVAAIDVDPRYYFHLAAAYLRAGRLEEAQRNYAEAVERDLHKSVLTASDRELLKEIEESLAAQAGSSASNNPAS